MVTLGLIAMKQSIQILYSYREKGPNMSMWMFRKATSLNPSGTKISFRGARIEPIARDDTDDFPKKRVSPQGFFASNTTGKRKCTL